MRGPASPARGINVGVDVVDVKRVARLVDENDGIHARVFSPREWAYCRSRRRRYEHLAARFAAKEAVLKAFGTGIGLRMNWTDVEIVSGHRGRPAVELHGEVAALAARRRLAGLDVSLAHTSGIGAAQAVAVWEDAPCAST